MLDQAIILALCLDVRNHNPRDGLTQEEMRPFVARALDTPLDWMVHSTGLLVRSWLEAEAHRTVERAVLQMQALADQHTARLTALQPSARAIEAAAPARDRLALAPCLVFPPRWGLLRQLADRYRSLGVLRSALRLYEELEVWDDVIEVLIALDCPRRAERLLRARLAVGGGAAPRLLCLLGHVTDDDAPFHAALEASAGRYARAHLDLGKRALRRGDAAAAMAALAAGLALAPHANAEWFLLGLTAMRAARYDTALAAFSRVVQLEPGSADAWANIGSLHLRARAWGKAFAALDQALRKDSSTWRVHSNFIVAAMRTRNYTRAMTAMRALADLRRAAGGVGGEDNGNSGVDATALGLLVQEVLAACAAHAAAGAAAVAAAAPAPASGAPPPVQSAADALAEEEAAVSAASHAAGAAGEDSDGDAPTAPHFDASGAPLHTLLAPLAALLEHITAVVSRDALVWHLFARVRDARGERGEATECRARACRALQTAGWERDSNAVRAVARASRELVRDYVADGGAVARTQARLHLQAVIGQVAAARVHDTLPEVAALAAVLDAVQEAPMGAAALALLE